MLAGARIVYGLAGSAGVITVLEQYLLSRCGEKSFAQPCSIPTALVTGSTCRSFFVLPGKTEDLMSDCGFSASHT